MQIVTALLVWTLVFSSPLASATDALTSEDMSGGVKQLLDQSANAAVDKLGVPNGFLDNPKVRITLPASLQKAEGVMRGLGMNKPVDNLVGSMNHAAEAAAAEAKPVLLEVVQKMSLEDARKILTDGGDAATQYFRDTTSDALAQKLLPIVKNAAEQAGVLKKYNEFAGKGAKLGLISEKDANVEKYITRKTMDGIYLMMAEEERAIRSNPMGQVKELQNVFNFLKKSR
ncbi:MAG TPA: DUF4197 domain-containing protein [Nitrosospira sp.]|nr:DUF4197 domain-containing protein [Nitrosospira sp.]